VVSYRQQALAAGRDAALAARFAGAPMPANPHRPGSKRALYWQWGVERADRLIDQLEEIG
jgi:hypothetical protein